MGIPTARPTLRKDLSDLVFKDQFLKWNAISKTCNTVSSTGQPILIGTTTIEKSEMLAELLNEYKLSYQLLNAKPENVRRESEIVAQAGKRGALLLQQIWQDVERILFLAEILRFCSKRIV